MIKTTKTAQDIQDDIFRKMSADQRLEVWVGLWRLAKELAGDKSSRTEPSIPPSRNIQQKDSKFDSDI